MLSAAFCVSPKTEKLDNSKRGYKMMKLISKFTLPIMIVTILYLLISGNLISRSPFVITVQLFAIALSVWARQSFQSDQFSIDAEPKEGQLLLRGPYQYIRHPMYASALILIWSGIGAHISPVNLVIGALITIFVAIRIVIEEQYLRTFYPDYETYSNRTKRIIPLII